MLSKVYHNNAPNVIPVLVIVMKKLILLYAVQVVVVIVKVST